VYISVVRNSLLGQKIIQLRSQFGLTQKELARRMRTSQQAISRLERGEYNGCTLRTLSKLARATGTELIIDFRGGSGPGTHGRWVGFIQGGKNRSEQTP